MEDMMQVKMVKMALIRDVAIRTTSLDFVIEAALQMLSVDESLLPTGEIVQPMEYMIPMLHRLTLDVEAIEVGVIEEIEMTVDVHHLGIDQQAQGWSSVQCNISLQEHQSQLVMIIKSLQDVSKVHTLFHCAEYITNLSSQCSVGLSSLVASSR
jgi:hypothetical protein